MSERNIVALLAGAVFVSACSSTSTLTYDCQRESECEQRAERLCRTKNYRVQARLEFKEAPQKSISERSGASDITGAMGQGMAGNRRLGDDHPRWRYTVECNPRALDPALIESTTTIYTELSGEQLAARERYKRMYMHEVCELTDPDLRREELEIARREFGDVSCPD